MNTNYIPTTEAPIPVSTIRPGWLVSLKTSLKGNVNYRATVIEADHVESDGSRRETREVERTIFDPQEHEAAKKVRGRASSLVKGQCAKSEFGLLCPTQRKDSLDRAIREARILVDAFNRTSNLTRVNVYVVVGWVASDDSEAIRAINSEIRDLLADMEQGVQRLDADTIRKAANKAKDVGRMLSPVAAEKLQIAINMARKAARKIVAAGEDAAAQVDAVTLKRLDEARTAFLDLSELEGPPEVTETPSEPIPVVELGPAIAVNLDLDANEEEGIDEDNIPAFLRRPAKRVALDLDD